jgi:hypothetical protein
LIQLLVVPDRKHDVARRDSRLFVVARRIPRKLQNLHRQILKNIGKENRRSCTNSVAVMALA